MWSVSFQWASSSCCTTVFWKWLRWMEEGQRDVGQRVTARVQPPTTFNIQPSPPLPSINSLMEAEEEGSTFGGKMPRSRMRAGGRGRRQHPGRTFVVLFPAVLAPLLHGLHKSLSAAFSRGIPTFSQGCAQLAMTPTLCQMTQSSAIASLICPFPGLWYFSSPVHVCHPLWCLLSRSLCGLSRWTGGVNIKSNKRTLSMQRGKSIGYTSSLLIHEPGNCV